MKLKKSWSIAVDDTTYFDQDNLREIKRKSSNVETSKITKINLSLPILQSSNYNNQYRDIHPEEIKQANKISTLKLTNNEGTNTEATNVNRSLSIDITNVTDEEGKINQFIVSRNGFYVKEHKSNDNLLLKKNKIFQLQTMCLQLF